MKDKEFYNKTIDQSLIEFGTRISGLTMSEVEKRRENSKKYLIKDEKKASFLKNHLQI